MAFTAQEIKDYIEAVQYDPVAIAQTAGKFNVSMDDIASAMGYDTGQVIDYLKTGLQKVGMDVYFEGGEQQGEAGSTYTPMTISSFSKPVEGSKQKYEAFSPDMQSRGIIDNGSLTSQILSDLSPVITMAVPFAGAELASLLGVSTATGTALVNAGMQVAQGGDAKSVLTGLVSSQLSQAASPMVASELQSLVSDPTTSKLITNIGTSVVNNVLNGNTSNLGKTILGSAVDTLVGDQTGNFTLGNVVGSAVTGGGQGAANTLAGIVGSSGSTAPTIDTYPETSDDLISILAGKPDNSSITAPTDTQSLLDILGDKSSQIIDDAPFVAAPDTQGVTQRKPTDYSNRSFNSAFAAARLLGEPDFTWKGQTFTTELAPSNTNRVLNPNQTPNVSDVYPDIRGTAADKARTGSVASGNANPYVGYKNAFGMSPTMGDINQVADPRTLAFAKGLLGDESTSKGFSALHPDISGIQSSGDVGTYSGYAAQIAPILKSLTNTKSLFNASSALDPALERFLQGSVLKDRVFHGTADDISAFSGQFNKATGPGVAGWVTPDASYASRYAAGRPYLEGAETGAMPVGQTFQEGANVIPMYASIKNPLNLDDPNVLKMLKEEIPFLRTPPPGQNWALTMPSQGNYVTDFAKQKGYDALQVLDQGYMTYAPLSGTQLKSAISNTGTYNPKDARLRYAAGGLAGGGLTQSQAQALETAYAAGDISTVNQLLSSGISAADVKNFWGFTDADIAGLSGLGVKFNQPVTTNDEVLNVVNQSTNVTNNTANTAAKTNTISDKPTAAELQALYLQNGVYTPTTITTEQGDQTTYNPIDYGNGTYLWEKPGDITGYYGQGEDATPIYAGSTLGGYSKKDGDFLNYYDVNGKFVTREKWNKGDWETIWDDLGPVISAAATGYLGTIPLGTTGLTAANALNAARALDSGNVMGLISNTVGALPGNTFNVAGYTAQDALNAAKFFNAAANNDVAGLVTSVGNLTGSADIKLAGAAAAVLSAANSGNDKALFDAVTGLNRVLNSGSTTKTATGATTSTAGTDTTLPTGVQLASTGDGVFRTDVGGVPTYAESSNASTVKAPLGYTLLSMSESDDKPAGSYYDITANAWFKPSAELTDLSGNANIQADAALFNNSLGTLDKLDSTRSADDFADFLASIGITNPTQLADSGLSNQDILDLINASTLGGTTGLDGTGGTMGGTSGNTGGTGDDTGDDDLGLLNVCGDGMVFNTATGQCEKVTDKGKVVVTGKRGGDACLPGTTLNPITGECDPNWDEGNGDVCGVGEHQDPATGMCVPDKKELTCPPGKVPNEAGTACIDATVIIGKPESCPVGTKLNLETGECDPYWDEGGGDVCEPGFHQDPATGMCVPDDEGPIKCDVGFHLGPDGKTCVADDEDTPCAEGFHRDETTGLCVPDDDETPCAEGFHRDDATGLCVPDDDEECKDGYEKVGGVCVPVCKEGYIRNLETGLCEKVTEDKPCPPGQMKNAEGKCVPIVVTPPPPPPKTCPTGYKLVNGVCVPIPKEQTFTPSGSYGPGEKNEPIYAGGMDEFNLLATLQELLANEAPKKDDKKSKDKTKMATGGHLDDLLAEQMTVDDLLKLLR